MLTFGGFYYEIVEEKMKKSELDTLFEIAKNISPNKSLKSVISKNGTPYSTGRTIIYKEISKC